MENFNFLNFVAFIFGENQNLEVQRPLRVEKSERLKLP